MAQNRLYNLIEYIAGTEKRYLMMDEYSSKAAGGEDREPDSQEWFDWLATLPSFHFKGKNGHFTARHEEKKKHDEDAERFSYWYAYRKAYGKQHKRYLGATQALTLAKLEQTAQELHTAVLSSLPEDKVLNSSPQRKPNPQGLTLGQVAFLWQDDMLKVQAPAGVGYLTKRQTAELLAYLYEYRASLLKTSK